MPVYGDIMNEESIQQHVANADLVINLVGILYERGKQNFVNIHAKAAENLAKYSKMAGVSKFIHISALGVDNKINSKYLRTKLNGERAVLASFPEAIIFRPSIIFGFEDNFFNQFAGIARYSFTLPAFGGGKTKFQPVYVGDVAEIIVTILTNYSKYQSQTIDIAGNKTYSFKELMQLTLDHSNNFGIILPLPYFFGNIIAFFSNILPKPLITNDQIRILKHDNVSDNNFIAAELAINLQPVEAILPKYLKIFKRW